MNLNRTSDEEFIRQLTNLIKDNLSDENFDVDQLVNLSGLSHYQLRHRLKSIRGKTISQFICEIRLQEAHKLLEQGNLTASEAAFQTGFTSAGYFNKCFHDFYGYSPGEVKKRKQNGSPLNGNSKPEPAIPVNIPDKKRIAWTRKIILAVITILFLTVLILHYFVFSPSDGKTEKEKSIAVLPFINDSPDSTNIYFINGIAEAINNNLSRIKDLMVISRTSTEQYRNNRTKSVRQISSELGAKYIVEGSGQKNGDEILLSVQLIEAKSDKHLFTEQYRRKVVDVFDLFSEVALDVAGKIKAKITPEEKELINKRPTGNQEALNYYQMGYELRTSAIVTRDKKAMKKAEDLFNKAILLDSTYADPYLQIGWINFSKGDTAIYLADKVLRFDPQNAEAYNLKGNRLRFKGLTTQAEASFRKALTINPSIPGVYRNLGSLYFQEKKFVDAIKNLLRATRFDNINLRENLSNYKILCKCLYQLGFFSESMAFARKILDLSNDSSFYYQVKISENLFNRKPEIALKLSEELFNIDSTYLDFLSVGNLSLYSRDYKRALDLTYRYLALIREMGIRNYPYYYLAFSLQKNGLTGQADSLFNLSIKTKQNIIDLNQPGSLFDAYLSMSIIYSAKGDKTTSLQYLKKAEEGQVMSSLSDLTKFWYHPMLDLIRNEPEYQHYLKKFEGNFYQEREKLAELLKEEGILVEKE